MSYNTNQENRRKPFNGNKKFNKTPKVNPNEIKARLGISSPITEDIYAEIIDILTDTKFNKVSIPLGVYKSLIDNNVDADDTRITTVGYIKNYDADNHIFTVVIFKGLVDTIKKFENPCIDILFTETRKGTLGTITKFTIRSGYNFTDPADIVLEEDDSVNTDYEATVMKI